MKQASLLKRKDYKFEREWRVVYAPICKSALHDVSFVGGKPRLPLRGSPVRELVREVVISHHGNPGRTTLLAELVKEKYRLDYKVVQSKSSYIG